MSDLLSSSSLLLAVLAVLLGLWYGEVDRASNESTGGLTNAQKAALRRVVKPVLWKKAVPLAAASGAVAGVFLYRTIVLAWFTVGCWFGWQRNCVYDELIAAFLVTEALTLLMLGVVLAKIAGIARIMRA